MRARLSILLIALSAAASAGPGEPKLTKEEAIQKARDFCTKIHQPVEGDASAQFGATRLRCWRTCWDVRLGADADVLVSDATGDILDYANQAYTKRPDTRKPAGKALPEEDARRISKLVMDAAGGGDEFAPLRAYTMQHLPALRRWHQWRFQWERRGGKLAYDRWHGASLTLDAEDGTVRGFTKRMPSPPPKSLEVRLTKDQGIAKARAALEKLQVGVAEVLSADTLIVTPNALWRGDDREKAVDPRREMERENRSCAAWVVKFRQPDKPTYWREVWIDAQDGSTLGGGQGGLPLIQPRPRSAKPDGAPN